MYVLSFFLISGVLFVALSGRADAADALRDIILFVALVAFVRLLWQAAEQILVRLKPKDPRHLHEGTLIRNRIAVADWACTLFLIGTIFIGANIDSSRIEESKARGDALARVVWQYQAEHGRCPDRLDGQFAAFRPALRGAEFNVRHGRSSSDCQIGFVGSAFLYCSRSTLPDGKWYCDD